MNCSKLIVKARPKSDKLVNQSTEHWLGEILAATAYVANRPHNAEALRKLGQALGRQIYIFDALEDLNNGDFNALLDSGEVLAVGIGSARYEQANRRGQELLALGQFKLSRLLAAVTLEDNAPLIEKMLLDNRTLWRVNPELLASAPTKTAPVSIPNHEQIRLSIESVPKQPRLIVAPIKISRTGWGSWVWRLP